MASYIRYKDGRKEEVKYFSRDGHYIRFVTESGRFIQDLNGIPAPFLKEESIFDNGKVRKGLIVYNDIVEAKFKDDHRYEYQIGPISGFVTIRDGSDVDQIREEILYDAIMQLMSFDIRFKLVE